MTSGNRVVSELQKRIYFSENLEISEKSSNFARNIIHTQTIMARILVIDDERAIRNTLKEILEFEGYTVEVAENGRVGLDMALSAKYDLISPNF